MQVLCPLLAESYEGLKLYYFLALNVIRNWAPSTFPGIKTRGSLSMVNFVTCVQHPSSCLYGLFYGVNIPFLRMALHAMTLSNHD